MTLDRVGPTILGRRAGWDEEIVSGARRVGIGGLFGGVNLLFGSLPFIAGFYQVKRDQQGLVSSSVRQKRR